MLPILILCRLMAKTNAEHQKGYCERKKGCRRFQIFPKERLCQEEIYKKVKDLSKRELKERREAVRKRGRKHWQYSKTLQRVLETSEHNTSFGTIASSSEP